MIIAVDVDDVLADTLVSFIEFYNQHYQAKHQYTDFLTYNFEDVLKLDTRQVQERILAFYNSSYDIQPVSGAKEALSELSKSHRLEVITARVAGLENITARWIEKYFPGIFSGLHFGHNHFVGCGRKTKAEICREIGAKWLIDDIVENLIPCEASGVKPIVFDRPWNREHLQCQKFSRASEWATVRELL